MGQELECIHENPVKGRNVDEPECRRYSSVRNYLGVQEWMYVSNGSGKYAFPRRSVGTR